MNAVTEEDTWFVYSHATSTWLSKRSKRRKLAQLLEVCRAAGDRGSPDAGGCLIGSDKHAVVGPVFGRTEVMACGDAPPVVASLGEAPHAMQESVEEGHRSGEKSAGGETGGARQLSMGSKKSQRARAGSRCLVLYAWATHWMLRAAEAAVVKAKHVVLNWKRRDARSSPSPRRTNRRKARGEPCSAAGTNSVTSCAPGTWQSLPEGQGEPTLSHVCWRPSLKRTDGESLAEQP